MILAMNNVIVIAIVILSHLSPKAARTVETSSGYIVGHPARNRSQVVEYLGIPYAKPPIGQLRFAAPQTLISNQYLTASEYVRLGSRHQERLHCIDFPYSLRMSIFEQGTGCLLNGMTIKRLSP